MNTVLNELLKERERLLDEITERQEELKVIQKLIDRRTRNESEETQKAFIGTATKRPYHALKDIFTQSPYKSFTPSELRDELENLKKLGLLKSNSENLLFVVHSSLKALIKKDVIEKESQNEPPTYKLSKTKTYEMLGEAGRKLIKSISDLNFPKNT